MKTIALLPIAASLACMSFAATAKKPHPDPLYNVGDVSCTCEWSDTGSCEVTWLDAGAPTYGVDIEFEAEWMADDVEMKSKAELDLDDSWMCDGISMCSASGEFSLPEYAPDADYKFVGKVKGFVNGPEGETPRNFIKTSGDCNLPADG